MHETSPKTIGDKDNNTLAEYLARELRKALLSEPRCREAVIRWATQRDEIPHWKQELIEALVGPEFVELQGNR